jgi:2-polyprenyl-6-methoxyphenol hydroxylase-like FAD-dependent oxidoreductase
MTFAREEPNAVRSVGFETAAFVMEQRALRTRCEDRFATMTVPDRQVAVYPIRGGKLATFFAHASTRTPPDLRGAGEKLRAVYGDLDWIVPEILRALPSDDEIYYDAVSQVVLPHWSRGRVTLVGDACQAVSLLAGQGASMAMGGAWALSMELAVPGSSLSDALARYESRVKPAIERKQRAGRRLAKWFVPSTSRRIVVRDWALAASKWPGLSWILANQLEGESIVR